MLDVSRVTLARTDAYLTPHVDLTTAPVLRLPLEANGRTLGVLEIAADADRLARVRQVAAQVAALVAARLADLREATPALAEALEALPTPVAVTAASDGAQVWRNRAYLVGPPPAAQGPDVVVPAGDLRIAAWGDPDATDAVRDLLDEATAAPDAVAVVRPLHDAAGEVVDFRLAWANRPRHLLPVTDDLFPQLTRVLRRQAPAANEAGRDGGVTLAPLGKAVVCTWRATADPDRELRSLIDREELFGSALDAILDPVAITLPVRSGDGGVADFEIVWRNRAHRDRTGSPRGSTLRSIAHRTPSVDIVDAHRRVFETGVPMVLDDVQVEIADETGDLVEAFADIGISRFGAGLLTSSRPATERIRAQRDLQESERLFRSVFDEAPRGTLLFSLDESCLGRCLRVNPAFQQLSGYTEEEFVDGGWPLVVPPDEVERTEALFADMAAGRVHRRHRECHVRTADGALLDVQADYSVVTRAGRPGYAVVHVEDITERRRAESEVSWLAMHDALTGLPNRHLFVHHVRHALSRLERRPGTLAVLSVVVRDDLEPDVADVLRAEVARRLADSVRRSDTPARLGGGDFAVLLPEVGGQDGARRLARRVAEALTDDVPLPDGDLPLHARVGTALTQDPEADAVHLVRAARVAAEPVTEPAQTGGPAGSEVVEPRQRDA
jgi:PAS domain S-box-containing protein/diguanylate cyclase (GGDEF)-like protein